MHHKQQLFYLMGKLQHVQLIVDPFVKKWKQRRDGETKHTTGSYFYLLLQLRDEVISKQSDKLIIHQNNQQTDWLLQ